MEELKKALKSHDTAPFLFLGSGFSRRYLATPAWDALLDDSASWMNKTIQQYKSKVSKYDPNDNLFLPHIATMMATDFVDLWWNDPQYTEQRKKYENIIIDYRSPLKVAVSEHLKSFRPVSTPEIQEELQALDELKESNAIDGIITTNWDCLAEEIFEYKRYIGQEELLFSNVLNVGEVFKIHGCLTSPNSLVLDEKDYADFNKRNPYLAAKLTTIFIEHPVFFIGYGLRDKNIREILDSLVFGIGEKNINKLGKGIYFIEYDRNNEGYLYSTTPVDLPNGSLDINYIRTDDYKTLYEILGTNPRKFPARLMRQMKEHLYELVLKGDPKEQLMVVTDLDGNEDPENIQFVYGAGVIEKISEFGYGAYSNETLYKDIIGIGDVSLDYKQVVCRTLIESSKHTVPRNKFIKLADMKLRDIPKRVLDHQITKHKEAISSRMSIKQITDKLNEINNLYDSLDAIKHAKITIEKKLEAAAYLEPHKIDAEELRLFIVDNYPDKSNTAIKRLIRYYDWLAYGRNDNKNNE